MKKDLQYKTAVRRTLDRQWSKFLSASEFKIACAIFTHTIEWGKTKDRLKREMLAKETGLCEKTVRTVLDRMEHNGLITRVRTQYGYQVTLNTEWVPMVFIPTPKKPRENNAKATLQSGKVSQSRVVKFTSTIREDHSLSGSVPTSPPVGRTTLPDVLKEEQRKQEERKHTRPVKDPAAIWASAWRETFPDQVCPMIAKGKAYGQLKHLLSDCDQPHAFIEWLVTDWRLIMGARFDWMQEPAAPEFPALGFALTFKEKFYDAWNNRLRLVEDLRYNGADLVRRKLMHAGLPYDDADKEVKAKSSIAANRDRAAAIVDNLNAAYRASEARRRERSVLYSRHKGEDVPGDDEHPSVVRTGGGVPSPRSDSGRGDNLRTNSAPAIVECTRGDSDVDTSKTPASCDSLHRISVSPSGQPGKRTDIYRLSKPSSVYVQRGGVGRCSHTRTADHYDLEPKTRKSKYAIRPSSDNPFDK